MTSRRELDEAQCVFFADVRSAVTLVYSHRSKPFSGTAFPMPMCDPPCFSSANGVITSIQERPFGLPVCSRNVSWTAKKTPILLNVFEHVVRGAVLNWWKSTAIDLTLV